MNRDRLLALLDDYVECALTEPDQDELEKLLLESPEARRTFWAYVQQHTLIHKIELEADGRILAKVESAAVCEIPVETASPAKNSSERSSTASSPRRRLGWRVWGVLAASVVVALTLAWHFGQRRAEAASLVLVSGSEVAIFRQGVEMPGHAGMELRWGDRAVTGDGAAVIRMPDNIQLELGAETTLNLTGPSEAGAKAVHLARGSVATEFDRSGSVSIDTPTAGVSDFVGPGRCNVVALANSTRVEVTKGSCRLKRKSDQSSDEVPTGHFAVASNESVISPRPLGGVDDDGGSPAALATWLGGPNADAVGGIAIAPDGTILVGATLPGVDLAAWQPEHQAGDGDGAVLRISPDGRRLLAVVRRNGSVDDLRIDAAGHVYLVGSAGCAKLNPALQAVWTADWKARDGRIAPGPDGGAVTLTGDRISVLDRKGRLQKEWSIADRRVHDIVCDPVNRVVYATGSNVPKPKEGAVPFVYAFDLTGKRLWTAHDWTRQQIEGEQLTAGSVGLRLALDKDGQLYVAGESHGGNTVWGRQSDDIREKLLGRTDRFQNPFGIGSQFLTFLGRLDVRTGRVLQSTMLLGRADNQRGSSMRPAALAVDAEGRVYVGGWAGATPPASKGAFGLRGEGEGAFLCVFDHDFKRLYAARLCGGTVTTIAPGAKAIAIAGQARDGLSTVAPFQAEPAGEEDGWLILFRKAPGIEYQSPILDQPRR